ncbi:hypothetical protein [Bacillus tuaregi]|uniref:hypothetical protein n=1 Tax=Bacillus tuaregi TaxID=1816695 RepID=UPI0008F8403F|nr:hypothetical protein [Bacillus tuaregi]
MIKKFFSLVLVLMLTVSLQVNALTLEDQDTPNSFQIEILPWTIVNHIIPRKSIFTITDVETGLQFTVQRRAGSMHADVQPLTHKDTKIMKKIYNGKWSWKRRAILVVTKDQMLAASMHGMPHGAGALKNGFPGHFCVHFLGSTTHGSKHEDLSHKLMILRAGGKLDDYLRVISPSQLIKVFEAAVNQGDQKIIQMIVENGENINHLQKRLEIIKIIRLGKPAFALEEGRQDVVFQQVYADAELYRSDNSKEQRQLSFTFWKDMVSGEWRMDDEIIVDIK